MNLKILKTLEFDKIRAMLAGYATGEAAAEKILSLEPFSDCETAKKALDEADAALVLRLKYQLPQIYSIKNPANTVKRINAGGVLSTEELLNIALLLKCADGLKSFYADKDDCLREYFYSLSPNNAVRDEIYSVIIGENEIADTASSELYSIRKKIRSEEQKIKNTLSNMVRSEQFKKYLQDAIVTQRSGRYVLPVRAEYRSEVPGIVHDISASGGTLFVEPQSSVNANNMLNELAIKEKREIEKILLELTLRVGGIIDAIEENYEVICELDILFAKASLAAEMKAVKPRVNSEGRINIINGRHPLIPKNKVVPENISLGIDFDSLIVTGPNTGGKTVALKTIGLFSLMMQSGLLVPADENTELSFFENIFADIGDEQSIEQSLSTFSAHMKNIVEILDGVTPDSLVLFDELGAGTDPTEGAALACAILEYVRGIGAKTAATTHYSELKMYALTTDGVENASCEFDVETLSPTYRILIGVPGKSNAFEISKKLGLSEYVIEKAREKISEDSVKIEDVLTSIEDDRQAAEKSRREQDRLKKEIEELKKELTLEREKIDAKKAKLIEKANKKASEIMEDAKNEAEELLLKMRDAQKNEEQKNALRAMEEVKKELNLKLKRTKTKSQQSQPKRRSNADVRSLKPGASVLLIDINDKGTVLTINQKDETAVVQMGIMKTVSKISNLVILEDETMDNIKKFISPASRSAGAVRREVSSVSTEIDLRGMTLEEAIDETDRFLDRSVMSGIHSVTLIHGKGTGVLRSGLQNILRRHPHVKSFRNGRYGEGENGVTVIELK